MDIYASALLYEIAFDFRDVPAECDFLLQMYEAHGPGGRPKAFLELGCGPGFHVVEMGAREIPSTGLDLSMAMIARLQSIASERKVSVSSAVGDMRSFDLGDRFSLAATLMDTASHLLSNQDILDHLDRVADHLHPQGIYVIELAHPANHFRVRQTARTQWTSERYGWNVAASWGTPDDPFDPITEVESVSVTLTGKSPEGRTEIHQAEVPVRRLTHLCLEALIALNGRFEVVDWFGSMSATVPFDNSREAWRMVSVLRRRESRHLPEDFLTRRLKSGADERSGHGV